MSAAELFGKSVGALTVPLVDGAGNGPALIVSGGSLLFFSSVPGTLFAGVGIGLDRVRNVSLGSRSERAASCVEGFSDLYACRFRPSGGVCLRLRR